MAIDKTMNMIERRKIAPIHFGQLSIRRQRIERWACKDRNTSINSKVIQSSNSSLRTSLIQKRSESSVFQADRRLNMDLFQLGEEREKLLERYNFDQKLFANKQALRHKNNPDMLRTVDYVRKCCKYSHMNDNKEELIDSTIFSEKNPIRSQPLASIPSSNSIRTQMNPKTFVRDNKKHIESSYEDENQKLHVQFRMNTKRGSQSAHVSRKFRSLIDNQRATSVHGVRITNSAPFITTIDHKKELINTSSKTKRPLSRIFSSRNSLQEFQRYPERFLSKSNPYLSLLHRQATEIESHGFYLKQRIQPILDRSDDAKSFLNEEIEARKSIINSNVPFWYRNYRRNTNKRRATKKVDLMETVTDKQSEYTIALSRLRDCEYAHLQKLIHSNSIEHILEPFSAI